MDSRGAALTGALLCVPLLTGLSTPSLAGTFYVNGSSPTCADNGPGTAANPYCTISAAVKFRSAPGNTISVSPGLYREQVSISVSGAQGSPLILSAASVPGSPVIVDGSDDFSSPLAWMPYTDTVWRASAVSWSPLQVFYDGARLNPATGTPESLTPGNFVYVQGQGLFANFGGTPLLKQILVGRRSYGIRVNGASWVNVDGFTVTRTEDRSIYLVTGSNNCEVTNNTITYSNKYGIAVNSCSNVLVRGNSVSYSNDHGIYLSSGVTASNIQENESSRNARPGQRAANGIQLNGSSYNVVQRNRLHDNQDSGLQINTSSNNNLSIQNMSWNNGDHGFDHLTSTGTMHLGDVAYRNYKDGFSVEGNSPNTTVVNCIGVDNGLTTNEFDLWVDSASSLGLVSNSNIFWNSNGQSPVKYLSIVYWSVSSYATATGKDTRSLQANPRWVDANAGDFHIGAGSPAIDAADSSAANWPVTDAEGRARVDDPMVADYGLGSVTYADRGAMEFTGVTPANQPPDGTIDSPAPDFTIPAHQTLVLAGSATDPDGNSPFTYLWDFGGALPNQNVEDPGAIAFSAPGTYTITFTVTDAAGLADPTPATRVVTVTEPLNLPPDGVIDSPAASLTIQAGQTLTFTGTGTDPEGHYPLAYTWNFGGAAPNSTLEDPGPVMFSTPGTYTVTFTSIDSSNAADPTPDTRVITVLNGPTNLVGNPSFETGTFGWSAYGGATITRVAGGIDGGFALEMRGTSASADFGINDTPNWIISTPAAGVRYRVSAYVRAASARGTARVKIREYAGSFQVGTTATATVTLTSGWQLLTLDYVAQRAGSTLDLQIYEPAGAAGEVFQVDGISIVTVP